MPFSTVQMHTIHSFRAVHNSLTCFDKKCTHWVTCQRPWLHKSHRSIKITYISYEFFHPLFSPPGGRASERKKRNVKGSVVKSLKKKNTPNPWLDAPPTSYYLAWRKVAFFSWPPITSKEFFIPSRSWSLTYLSPLMMYKKVEEISQCSFKNCPLQGSQ